MFYRPWQNGMENGHFAMENTSPWPMSSAFFYKLAMENWQTLKKKKSPNTCNLTIIIIIVVVVVVVVEGKCLTML